MNIVNKYSINKNIIYLIERVFYWRKISKKLFYYHSNILHTPELEHSDGQT